MSKELLFSVRAKDCEWEYFRSGGNGGQHRDKTSNCCRVRHRPSGAHGECSENRSQRKNKEVAFRRMGESKAFQTWARTKALGLEPLEAVVDRMMAEELLKIEHL